MATVFPPEDSVGPPVLLVDRISVLVDGKGGDALHQSQGVDLVHAVQVGLGELVVLHVRKVVSEPGEEGNQVVEGEEVELNCRGPAGPLFVPRSLQVLHCRGTVNTGNEKKNN